jgi:hypothetical protein
MTPAELQRVEKYLKKTFHLDSIVVKKRLKKEDSAEVYVDDEFVAVLSKDVEDGETTYHFQMAILADDLN